MRVEGGRDVFDLIRNELTKFVFSRYNMIILLFITIVLITLFLIFPFIFNYDNDQQTFHGKDWVQQVEKKQESLFKKNQRSEEHTSELQSRGQHVCRLLLEKKTRN